MNHSTTPNLSSGLDPHSSYAARDIKKGEEFFEDYDSFGWPKWLIKLSIRLINLLSIAILHLNLNRLYECFNYKDLALKSP